MNDSPSRSSSMFDSRAGAVDGPHHDRNVVVSTPRVGQNTGPLPAHHKHDPGRTAGRGLVFRPAKALTNDQFLRWKLVIKGPGMDPEAVRQSLLCSPSVLMMTPGVVHAWLLRTATSPE